MPTGCSSPAASPIFTLLEGRSWLRREESCVRSAATIRRARPNRPANAEFRPQIAFQILRLRHYHYRAEQMAGLIRVSLAPARKAARRGVLMPRPADEGKCRQFCFRASMVVHIFDRVRSFRCVDPDQVLFADKETSLA